jgi:hypothetical protein
MASTYYASVNTATNNEATGYFMDVDHAGTASTSGDTIELRMGNGTYAPDRRECLLALKRFERWIMQGGLDQAGANLPLPTGSV